MPATVRTLIPAAILALALGGCATHAAEEMKSEMTEMTAAPRVSAALGKTLSTAIQNTKGQKIGEATFTQGSHGVVVRVAIEPRQLIAGWHGLHIHEKADCSDMSAGFKASGAHVGHVETLRHGLLNPEGPEPGDLPNLFVANAAAAGAEFYSDMLTLAAEARGGQTPLLDADGSALIIHANADDHSAQPIGGAGDRVACAALQAS